MLYIVKGKWCHILFFNRYDINILEETKFTCLKISSLIRAQWRNKTSPKIVSIGSANDKSYFLREAWNYSDLSTEPPEYIGNKFV